MHLIICLRIGQINVSKQINKKSKVILYYKEMKQKQS